MMVTCKIANECKCETGSGLTSDRQQGKIGNSPIYRMIRSLHPEDAPAIAAIYAHYVAETTISFETVPPTSEQMTERLTHITRHYPALVWEEEGKILGYCYAHAWKERAAYSHSWETSIYLTPQVTRQGIGRALMQELITRSKAAGCHVLIACITGDNAGSRRFHEKLGFTPASHFKQVGYKFGHRLDVTDYQLQLDC